MWARGTAAILAFALYAIIAPFSWAYDLEKPIRVEWKHDEKKRIAKLALPDGRNLQLKCWKAASDTVVATLGDQKYFEMYFYKHKGDYFSGHAADFNGPNVALGSSRFSRFDNAGEAIFFLKRGNVTSKQFVVADTLSLIEKLEKDCKAVPPPVIWAHGDTCPANLSLARGASAQSFFKRGPIFSGKLAFSPTQNAAQWCRKEGHITYSAPNDILDLRITTKRDHFREFGCVVKQICPEMETITFSENRSGMRMFFAMATRDRNFVPLTQKEYAALSKEQASECDRLASHPEDRRRAGSEGVPEMNMQPREAAEACRREIAQTPNQGRLHFQLGRALLLLGKMEEAFGEFSTSAKLNYPMGMLYLGHAHANAWGTKEDLRQANIYWRRGHQAGAALKNTRELELTVASATGIEARILCDRLDSDCLRRKKFQSFLRELPNDELRDVYRKFYEIHEELRPIYVGFYRKDFEELDRLKLQIYNSEMSSVSALSLVTELIPSLKPAIEEGVRNSRLEPFIAQYALSKTKNMGLCGEPPREFEVKRERHNSWRNAYGVELSSNTEQLDSLFFKVPVRFASFINVSKTTGEWFRFAPGLKNFFNASTGCDTELLQRLEEGMFSYQNWRR